MRKLKPIDGTYWFGILAGGLGVYAFMAHSMIASSLFVVTASIALRCYMDGVNAM
jgi:hypothetical protein